MLRPPLKEAIRVNAYSLKSKNARSIDALRALVLSSKGLGLVTVGHPSGSLALPDIERSLFNALEGQAAQ